jgi:hypothetical protein
MASGVRSSRATEIMKPAERVTIFSRALTLQRERDTTAMAPTTLALAATAGGRYIIALAPRTTPDPGGSSVEPVVYTVTW